MQPVDTEFKIVFAIFWHHPYCMIFVCCECLSAWSVLGDLKLWTCCRGTLWGELLSNLFHSVPNIHVWGKDFINYVTCSLFPLCLYYLNLSIFHQLSFENFYHRHHWSIFIDFQFLRKAHHAAFVAIALIILSVLYIWTVFHIYTTQVCKGNCSLYHA